MGSMVSESFEEGKESWVPSGSSLAERLAGYLPDVPRWLEVRSMLLSGRCEVLGLEEREPQPSFVARELEEGEDQMVYVVGRPSSVAIREAARRNRDAGMAMAVPEDASYIEGVLPGWTATRATLHLLGDAPHLPDLAEGEVEPLGASDLHASWVEDIPEDLRSFLEDSVVGAEASAAAALEGGRPVSFCVAWDQTEGLWDVSIDTLEGHRRRGHAARCVSWLVDEVRRRGMEPVWAAEETNVPSMRLAARLGFVPVDELVLFRPS
jgi:GNAT superfamily N-acetyltransferase